MTASRRLKAPSENGAVLAVPPLANAADLVAENRRLLNGIDQSLLGRSFTDLRRQARESALEAAHKYHREAGEPLPAADATSFVMAGHQPELFHPGVWVKNFALNSIARAHGAAPLNLVVDNDTLKSTSVRLATFESNPQFAFKQPEIWKQGAVLFDRRVSEVPHEERHVVDEALFASFAGKIRQAVKAWGFVPLLPAFWAEVLKQAKRTPLLGERFAAARRTFERRWGCHNLEVPIGALCRTEPFAWFACHLLANLSRFHAVHNDSLRAFRRAHRIRGSRHPLPDLGTLDSWLEAPFWAWTQEKPRRQRLLIRQREARFELRVGDELAAYLPASFETDPAAMISAWRALEQQRLKIRTRALTTTLYTRLFLADLFIHGIGGAKYDEVTDDIIRRFYGIEPPRFMTFSATLLLPVPTFSARPADCQWLSRLLRDLHCNPQRHLRDGAKISDPTAFDLAAQKRTWIERDPPDPPGRRERFHVLKQLTGYLEGFVAGPEEEIRRNLIRCRQELNANAVLGRRDYAFCLYPEEQLHTFCKRFL